MKKRIALIGLFLSIFPFLQPFFIKTFLLASSTGIIFSTPIIANSENALFFFKSGDRKYSIGDYEGAIKDYSKVLEIDPLNANAYLQIGNCKDELKDFEGAIIDYEKAIQINPKDTIIYMNIGNTKNNLREYKAAITYLDKSIEIDPKNGGAFYNRAKSYSGLEDFDQAISDLNKSIELMKNSIEKKEWENISDAYNNRGFAKEKLGDFYGAISDYNKAIDNDSTKFEPYLNRGRSHYFLNNQENACLDFKKAVSLGDIETGKWLESAGGSWCKNF